MKIGYLMQAGVPDIRQQPLSGAANHVKHIFNELQQLGHTVRLVANMNGQILQSDDLEHYEVIQLPRLTKGPFNYFERGIRRVQYELHLPYIALFESLRFATACQQALEGYDVYLERMGWMGYGGAIASQWTKIPLVLEVNGDHLSELEMLGMNPTGWQRKLSMMVTRHSAQQASHVIATGEGWRQKFVNRWDVSEKKVSVVENGSEVVNSLNQVELPAFQENNHEEDEITAVYVGGFEPWHGLTVLLNAFALARDKGANLRLLLIGDGSERETLLNLVDQLNIASHVVFTGHLKASEFPKYLPKAEIGLSPYCGRVEYSGLKLLDYKAAGLATIASGENGYPKIISEGETGLIVQPCNQEDLCQALLKLTQNHSLRRQMGQQARLEAEKYHSWHHTAQQVEEILQDTIGS